MSFEITEQLQRHLDDDRTIMLTTVTPTGRPAPRPVWFLWDGTKFVIYSEPNKIKLRDIAVNPHVALTTNMGPGGGDVVSISGTAEIPLDAPAASDLPAYLDRYAATIPKLGMTNETFAAAYSVAIHVIPTRAWAIP